MSRQSWAIHSFHSFIHRGSGRRSGNGRWPRPRTRTGPVDNRTLVRDRFQQRPGDSSESARWANCCPDRYRVEVPAAGISGREARRSMIGITERGRSSAIASVAGGERFQPCRSGSSDGTASGFSDATESLAFVRQRLHPRPAVVLGPCSGYRAGSARHTRTHRPALTISVSFSSCFRPNASGYAPCGAHVLAARAWMGQG